MYQTKSLCYLWGEEMVEEKVDKTVLQNWTSATKERIKKFENVLEKIRDKVNGTAKNNRRLTILKTVYPRSMAPLTKIINDFVQNIMNLPTIHGTNPNKVHDFYEGPAASVQAIGTMGKLGDIKG